jgi:hypothetical protein
MYYSERGPLPNAAAQRIYFACLILALLLIGGAMWRAQPGANPDYRPPSSARH